jgi:ATP-binding cassette subfamily B (MDR/TAP) protein 1
MRLSTAQGIGDKAPQFVQYTVMFGAGVTIAFIRNWRMSLVLLSIFPAIGLAGSLALPAMTSGKRIVLDHLARAGTLAEEAISSIRTVQAYNTRDRLVALYDEPNADAQAAGKKTALGAGWGVGSIIVRAQLAFDARARSLRSSSSTRATPLPSGGEPRYALEGMPPSAKS